MIQLKQAVIVEGKYDRIRLNSFIDALILQTDGFRIFKNKEKRELIARLARTVGIIVFTDSDRAGQLIRNHIKSIAKGGKVYHVYIPQIFGKEKRKTSFSKEGTLGVEGMSDQVLLDALRQAGVLFEQAPNAGLQKVDLLEAGLVGAANSAHWRRRFLAQIGLPTYLTANALLELLNRTFTREEFEKEVKKLYGEEY